MFTLQARDAKADLGIQAVAGSCPNSVEFINLVNTVTRRIMRRGGFNNWLIKVCISGCHVVWPEFVSTIHALRFCGNSQSQIRGKWWSIIGSGRCGGFGPGVSVRDGNDVPTYNVVSGNEGKLIRYYVEKSVDVGKTVTLFGKKFGGGPLMEFVDGGWRQGLTLTAAAPFGTTSILVTEITSVVREATQGIGRLYEYDATTDLMRDLAIYSPNETNPRYRSSIISGCIPFCTDANGVKTAHVEALVDIAYRPLVNDYDFLLIDNLDALSLGIQSIKLEQANDIQGSTAMLMAAISEMNYELRSKEPELHTSIRLNVWGDGTGILCNPI